MKGVLGKTEVYRLSIPFVEIFDQLDPPISSLSVCVHCYFIFHRYAKIYCIYYIILQLHFVLCFHGCLRAKFAKTSSKDIMVFVTRLDLHYYSQYGAAKQKSE